jgi:hypothetical protein
MSLSRLGCALSLLLAVACATASAPPSGPPPDWRLASASMSTGNTFQGVGGTGGQISAVVAGNDISSANINLAVGASYVRGQGNSGSVNVTITGNRADGSVRGLPFSCIVETNPDGSVHVTGAMGRGNTDFILSPKEFVGRVGMITYSLTWNGTRYQGSTMPGGSAWMQLPAVMATWGDVQVATVLSILLLP